jgi:hypothetical protein
MAMSRGQVSLKRVGVDKTNARIVAITGIAAFVVVFSIVASTSLIGQLSYQNRVIGKKRQADNQLESNLKARDSLVTSYKSFVSTPQNIIGGNPGGTGPKDGSNAKIVLDALPSKYDFPALASSLEKVMGDQGVAIKSLTGTDDSVAQAGNASSAEPAAVPVPFEISIEGPANNVRNALTALELSIRPFQVQKIEITGDQQKLDLTISAQTFYQPETALTITQETVK